MSAKKSALLMMAKMALADGHIAEEEKARLLPFLDDPATLETIFEEARVAPLVQLLGQVDRYADRFFIALQTATMAHVDGRVTPEERALYQNLLGELQLRQEDVQLIEASLAQLDALEPVEPDPRIGELFEQSSFC